MIYYLDGYNYLFLSGKEEDPLDLSREEVLEEFSKKIENLELIVVFDAHSNLNELSRTYYKNIEVIYTSHGQSADDFILEKLHFSKRPYDITIVSNDKKLLREARDLRANVLSFEKFLKQIKKKTIKDDKSNSQKFTAKDHEDYLKKFEP